MMYIHAILFCASLLIHTELSSAAAGYFYQRPPPLAPGTGHQFAPLPTVVPLPPVPNLPPLPTPRSGHVQLPLSFNSASAAYIPPISTEYSPHVTYGLPTSAITAPGAKPQPLRVPYGKNAIINYPVVSGFPSASQGDNYLTNGRQLKQYAVIEIIDNDVEHNESPFLPKSSFESVQQRFDINSIGESAFTSHGGIQLNSRANTLVLEQQARAAPGDSIALGSGGLGYIRLPNGSIYLGSGSLGYISNQQRVQSVRDARTRSEASAPNALHFGHGPLGGNVDNFIRF